MKTIELIHKLYQEKIVPGVSYAIIHQGSMISEIFGFSQIIPKRKKLKQGMLYDMASLTKVIGTTTVILKLIEQGKLNLDTPISIFLPKFKDDRVTLKHLLTHTSSISGYIKNRSELSASELLEAIYSLKVGRDFEKEVVYTDTGLILAGQIIEKFYKKPVQKVIEKEVLKPLNLYESSFTPRREVCVPTEFSKEKGLICGRVHDPKAFVLGENCGSAGLFMSLNDVIKFTEWFLDKNSSKVVSSKLRDALFKDWTKNKLKRSIGWDLKWAKNNEACIYHTGFTGTFLLIDKKNQDALIVLTNRIHPNANNEEFLLKRDEIVNLYLKEKEKIANEGANFFKTNFTK